MVLLLPLEVHVAGDPVARRHGDRRVQEEHLLAPVRRAGGVWRRRQQNLQWQGAGMCSMPNMQPLVFDVAAACEQHSGMVDCSCKRCNRNQTCYRFALNSRTRVLVCFATNTDFVLRWLSDTQSGPPRSIHATATDVCAHLEVSRVLGRPLEARVEPAAECIHEAAVQDAQLTARLQGVNVIQALLGRPYDQLMNHRAPPAASSSKFVAWACVRLGPTP